MPPHLKKDEILRLKGDLDGAIASATSQLATRHSPSSSIRTLTMACLESGRELEGIAALRNTCDGNDDAVVRAMLLLRSRIADQSERSALCMLANDYTMRLIMEGADSSKIIRSIAATSQAGLALERTTLDAIRLAVAKETALPEWLSLRFLGACSDNSAAVNLFVSGCPRSGTSALGRLLRLCPEIALYHERFGPHLGYSQRQFEGNNAIVGVDSQFRMHDWWMETWKCSASARYVGDKMPLFTSSWHITRHNYSPKNIRIIHIVRSAEDVAASYVQRCRRTIADEKNGARGWARERNELAAAFELNTTNRLVQAILDSEYSNAVLLVQYDRLFSDEAYALQLFQWLGLHINDQLRDGVHSFIEGSRVIAQKQRLLGNSVQQRLGARLDRSLQDRVMARSFELA